MKKILYTLSFLFLFAGISSAQTYTFECVCENVSGSRCDICNQVTQSRFFCGLLVKKNGVPHKWIDSPYIIKWNGNTAVIQEIIPAAETISIAMSGTEYTVLDSFKNAIICPCIAPEIDIAVDTPIIGNGTPGNPLTIGQFGADTNDVLIWNGHHWYPGQINFTGINTADLPYYLNDEDAMADGLSVGDTYLLDCGNTLGMPAGVYKVVKICGFDCMVALKYFIDDESAFAAGIPQKAQYCVDEANPYGIQNGFVKLVVRDSIYTSGTLACDTTLTYHDNDIDALGDGKSLGNLYAMSSTNTYGAPTGMERAVSQPSSTMADTPTCCSLESNLPFYTNDTTAVGGGLSAGSWYYLASGNTYGYPYSTKKQVQ